VRCRVRVIFSRSLTVTAQNRHRTARVSKRTRQAAASWPALRKPVTLQTRKLRGEVGVSSDEKYSTTHSRYDGRLHVAVVAHEMAHHFKQVR
jgi:hypothetical protein